MIVHTESGSRYEIEPGRARRLNDDAAKRGDGDWQELYDLHPNPPVIGSSMVLVMNSLAALGPDDVGGLLSDPDHPTAGVTTRRTTPVTQIEGAAENVTVVEVSADA